jgi:hypothetical protein
MQAVTHDGLLLEHVFAVNQTDPVCIEAIKNNSIALKFIKNKIKSIYLKDIDLDKCLWKINLDIFTKMEDQDEDFCNKLLNNNLFNLKYIINPTKDMCFRLGELANYQYLNQLDQYIPQKYKKEVYDKILDNKRSHHEVSNLDIPIECCIKACKKYPDLIGKLSKPSIYRL